MISGDEQMKDLSAGVQKIFREATRSVPMETEKGMSPKEDVDLKSSYVTQHNISTTVHSEEEEEEEEEEEAYGKYCEATESIRGV